MPRKGFRRTFRATVRPLAIEGVFDLVAERGCYRRQIDKQGDVVADFREDRVLRAEIGDRLLVSHGDLAVDEIAVVSVAHVIPGDRGEKHCVRVKAGAIANVPHGVYVQPMRSWRPPASKRRRAKAVRM